MRIFSQTVKCFFFKKNKLKIDILSMIGGRFLSSGLYFLFSILLMHYLSVSDYGKYTYYYSIIVLIPFFVDMGTNNAYVALFSKSFTSGYIQEKLRTNYLYIKYILILVVLGVSLCLLALDIINLMLSSLIISGLILGVIDLFLNLLSSKKEFKKQSVLMPIRNVLSLAGLLIVVAAYPDELNARTAVIIQIVAVICFSCICLSTIADIAFKRSDLDKDVRRRIYQYSKWLVLYGFSTAVMMRLDVFILNYYAEKGFIEDVELGYFASALTISMMLPLVTNSIVKVILPTASSISTVKEYKKYIEKLKSSISIVLCTMLIFVVLLSAVVTIFYSEKYGNSVPLIWIICLATTFSFYSNLLMPLYYATDETALVAKVGFVQLICNILVSIVFIFFFGALGSAISLLIVRVFGFVLLLINLKGRVESKCH